MKKIVLSLFLAFAINGMAQAAQWDGGYLGVSIGQTDGDSAYKFVVGGIQVTPKLQSGVSSIQGGYNWQSGTLVYGVAASLTSDIEGSTPCPNANFQCKTKVSGLTTVSGLVGTVLGGSYLLYGKLGLAMADVKDYGTPYTIGDGETKSRSGTIAGIGVAGPVGFFGTNWTWQSEYQFVDLGTAQHRVNTAPEFINNKVQFSIFSIGLNYKF